MLGDRRDLSTHGVTCRSQLRRPLDDQSARQVCRVRVFGFVVPPYVVSPVTWTHHMVWVVPVIIWLAASPERPGRGRPAAVLTALLFWCAPVWWIPSGVPELMKTSGTIFILTGAAGTLLWRRVTYRRIDQFPEQLPALVIHSAK
jgi:Flp pilus assembly protein TadB